MISGSRTSKSTEASATPGRIFLKLKKVRDPTDQPNLANLQQNTIRNHYQPPQFHKLSDQQSKYQSMPGSHINLILNEQQDHQELDAEVQ